MSGRLSYTAERSDPLAHYTLTNAELAQREGKIAEAELNSALLQMKQEQRRPPVTPKEK